MEFDIIDEILGNNKKLTTLGFKGTFCRVFTVLQFYMYITNRHVNEIIPERWNAGKLILSWNGPLLRTFFDNESQVDERDVSDLQTNFGNMLQELYYFCKRLLRVLMAWLSIINRMSTMRWLLLCENCVKKLIKADFC